MKHRHELRSLTYVTLDQSNGGIVRNLSREGIGVQAVAAVPPLQEVRIRFELRYPRVRVEARGLVVWSTFSGQCGIRFVDLAPSTTQHIQEWIFGNLLERAWLHADQSMFAAPALRQSPRAEEDGLLLSPTAVRVIELPEVPAQVMREEQDLLPDEDAVALDWFWHPLSGAGLSWTVNVLAVVAGLLLFALVFLSVAQETPSWPVVLSGAAVVPAMYWGFFQLFGGCSLGERLARLSAGELEEAEEPAGARFR
jgi:hypothetical protein